MLTSDTPVRPHPSVVFTRLDATEAVLLHLGTKRYYSLHETGALVWELVQEGRPLTGIAEALQAEYTVESAPAMTAVLAFVDVLLHEGLVQTQTASRHV
jgi:coenzyme PQQ synthesis protein D (PqqD)